MIPTARYYDNPLFRQVRIFKEKEITYTFYFHKNNNNNNVVLINKVLR